jgi:hypothetical protein
MNERPHRFPARLLARLKAVWRGGRMRARKPNNPEDMVVMAGDCGPRDVGLAPGEAHHVSEQRRLHRLADWTRLRGRSL